MKPRFNVGDRVRVRVAKDVIPESEIVCDVGVVVRVTLQYPGTKMERIIYAVRLDGIYTHLIESLGFKVNVGEGWNMAANQQSIEQEV